MEEQRVELKNLIADLPQLFERLKTLLVSSCDAYNEVVLQESRYNTNETERLGGRVSFENSEVVRNNLQMAMLRLIDNIQSADLKEKAGQSLNPFHAHTCNRHQQNDHFKEVFIKKPTDKARYFYMYGYYLEQHRSLFNRFAFDLQGGLNNQAGSSGSKIVKVEMPITYSQNLEVFKIEILKEFLGKFEVEVNQQEPILEKNLAWLYDNSAPLQGLGAFDYVCIFINISEWDWDKAITPEITRWFISHFCEVPLPTDSPTFLFFFSVSYEDENSPVEEEVKEVISQSQKVVGLPELEMVSMRDIASWFNRYSFIKESSRELVELRNQHFSGAREFYMDDVEKVLRKIIDEYNEQFF